MGKSRGTVPLQLAGNVKRGGLVERAFGLTVRELVYDYGGGTATRPAGARGADRRTARRLSSRVAVRHAARLRSAWPANDALLGHGGVVVFDDTVDMARMARYALEFCAIESCGKCTPCRIGSTRGVELIDRIIRERASADARTSRCSTISATPWLQRLAVRAGRHDAVSGAQRAQALSARTFAERM